MRERRPLPLRIPALDHRVDGASADRRAFGSLAARGRSKRRASAGGSRAENRDCATPNLERSRESARRAPALDSSTAWPTKAARGNVPCHFLCISVSRRRAVTATSQPVPFRVQAMATGSLAASVTTATGGATVGGRAAHSGTSASRPRSTIVCDDRSMRPVMKAVPRSLAGSSPPPMMMAYSNSHRAAVQ